jgi:phosphatidylethanolamine-binding protein (PEBP) family uncharacterized protein
MKVLYNNSEVKNGIFLTTFETRMEPKVDFKANTNKLYMLVMHDPDAVVGNYFHWLVVNVQGDKINNGDKIFDYKGPAPPKGSGIHRYIFLLYEQPENINVHFTNRMMTMDDFYEKIRVHLKPITSVYFTSKNHNGGKSCLDLPFLKVEKKTKRTKTKGKRKKNSTRRRKI